MRDALRTIRHTMRKRVLVAALSVSALLGLGTRAYAATCSGGCGGCTYSFVDCGACMIDEGSCTWSYSECSSVDIHC